MKRRTFLAALGGAAASSVSWPLAAWAHQRVQRLGVLMPLTPDDPEQQTRLAAFLGEFKRLGWTGGSNIRIDIRWGAGKTENYRKHAAELLALEPDLILAASGSVVAAVQRATRTVPIVFAQVVDPIGAGLVAGLSRPGGNATGFTLFEYGMSAKWLELLKQIAPSTRRVAALHDPRIAAGVGQLAVLRAAAPSFGVELTPVDIRDPQAIERGISQSAGGTDGGLIATASPSLGVHRDLIISLAARHRVPAVYPFRFNAARGGLMSYGPDLVDTYRRAANYVDRILRGAKPDDLPVQNPSKFELVINLKTAKAIGIGVPPTLLALADEVIE